MAPLPKRRHSTRRGGKRKAAISLSIPTLSVCPQCKKPVVPHQICPHCGYYRGVQLIVPKVKTSKEKRK